MATMGLVLEGGGLRGLFTAGVLDYLYDAGVEIDYVIGVSAGACNAISYISKQRGRNYYINYSYSGDPRYISVGNYLRTGSMVGEQFLYHDIPDRIVPFDHKAYQASRARLVAVCTDLRTGQPFYQRIDDCAAQIDVIRASASLPFISRPVAVDGHLLLDGGTADSIPLQKSIQDGNLLNLVVLTRPQGYRKKESGSDLGSRLAYSRYPQFVAAMKRRPTVYNVTLDLVEQEEKEGRAVALRPSAGLEVARFERNKEKLRALYLDGYQAARRQGEAILRLVKQAENARIAPPAPKEER
ncbi:MAG TPA: patatin family protein [Firmicutes bacterium]|nr:patatin family protein [Bacillota bacterium]